MKYFILLIVAWSCCLNIWADDVTIPLIDITDQEENPQHSGKDKRSLCPALEASHDGRTVYIYSPIQTESIQVTVADQEGNMVYENEVTGSFTFTLGSQVKGELTLQLEIMDWIYEGVFNIE